MINRWHTRLVVVMLLASVSVVSADNPEDGISRVSAEARDLTVVQSYHGRIMKDPQAISCTLRFLRHGHFISDEKRQPIPDGGAGS
jgi:hypothetical protein